MSRSFNKTQYRINPTNNSVIKFSKISQKIKNQQPKKKNYPYYEHPPPHSRRSYHSYTGNQQDFEDNMMHRQESPRIRIKTLNNNSKRKRAREYMSKKKTT